MSIRFGITVDDGDDAALEKALREVIVATTERILKEDGHNILDTIVAKHKMLEPGGLLLGEMINTAIDAKIKETIAKAVTQVPKKVIDIVDKAIEKQVNRVMEHYHAQSVQVIQKALESIHNGAAVNKAAKVSIEQRVAAVCGDTDTFNDK